MTAQPPGRTPALLLITDLVVICRHLQLLTDAEQAAARQGLLHRLRSVLLPRPRGGARSSGDGRSLASDTIHDMLDLMARFDRDGERKVLDATLDNQVRWLESGLLPDLEAAAVLTDHARLTWTVAERWAPEYFAETERIAREAVRRTRPEKHDPHLANRLLLAARGAARQEDGAPGAPALVRAADDLRRAVEIARRAVPVSLEPARELVPVLVRLHGATGEDGPLTEALAVAHELVRATVDGHPRAGHHWALLAAVQRRAVARWGAAAVRAVLDRPTPGAGGGSGMSGADRTGGTGGVNRVEALWDAAENPGASAAARWGAAVELLDAVPGDDADRPLALVVAAEAELRHWREGGDDVTPLTARARAVRAADAAPPGHPLASRALVALAEATIHAAADPATAGPSDGGAAQRPTAAQGPAVALAEAAVAAVRQAVPLLRAGDPGTPESLDRLAGVLFAAVDVLTDITLLPESVDLRRQALALTPPGDTCRPFRLANLSQALRELADARADHALGDEAVACAREAADALPEGDPARDQVLFNLGAVLSSDPMRDEDAEGRLAEAEQAYRRGLAGLPAGHPDVLRFLSAIGRVRLLRYEETGDRRLLDDAVALVRDAVARTPRDHGMWWGRNECLARACTALHEAGGGTDPALRAEALAAWEVVATAPAAPAHQRVEAQERRAALARAAGDPALALRALEAALDELSVLSRRSLTGPWRKGGARHSARIAARAAEAALDCGRTDRAVELLENGRAVLYGQAIATRRHWAPLRAIDPEAAGRLAEIDARLGEADFLANVRVVTTEVVRRGLFGRKTEEKTDSVDLRPRWAEETRRLAAERAALLERLTRHPDFAELMRPEPLHRLRARVAGAPVVFVLAHRERGDALLVPADPERPVVRVPLPGLSEAAVRERVHRLEAAVADAGDVAAGFDRREAAQAEVHAVLAWLWDEVAGPVLERLPEHGPGAGGEPPRLWWCPVGAVVRLPLHAAGHHRAPRTGGPAGGRPRTVVDRVVPSYTPTLGALAHALRDTPPQGRGRDRTGALVVAVPDAPGMPPLPLAGQEAQAVMGSVPGSRLLLGGEATLPVVEAALRDHRIVHFACHGDSDAALTTLRGGGLHLASGETLTALHVQEARLEHGALAFLSACGTAEGHRDMPDEPMHLAAAFQLAGFRSVIGTLWPAPDSAAVAGAVYAGLTARGTRPPDTTFSADALNTALRAIRDTYPEVPTRWAAYLHTGA